MNINLLYHLEGAKQARGLAVTIDVFRAFTTACYVIANGAEKIIPVEELDVAYKLKGENPDYVLIGERQGYIQPGFDFGNSPFQIQDVDFTGKTVIQATTAGTRGLVYAKGAEEIITGSFVNAQAIINHIEAIKPAEVSLICTGTANETILDEDKHCAEYIKNTLEGKPNDFQVIYNHLKNSDRAKRFFDETRLSHPVEDFDLCLTLDKFDFILIARKINNKFCLIKNHENI